MTSKALDGGAGLFQLKFPRHLLHQRLKRR
jgi:hypothetical protein